MNIWHVGIDFTVTTPTDEDQFFDVIGDLDAYAASGSLAQDLAAGGVLLTVESEDATTALSKSISLVTDAIRAHQIEAVVTEFRVQREDVFERDLATPIFPEVVGYAEIASMADVSRQRARQFADVAGFPTPVIETAQGPLMAKSAVERWLETRNRKTGRPRSSAA